MHTRKHSVGRNILRVFEIALFLAVSVLGYGLLLKASSFNTKSKSRDRDSVAAQNAIDLNGRNRELKLLSCSLLFPGDTAIALPGENSIANQAFASIHPFPLLARRIIADKDYSTHYLDGNSRLPRPCNLLEQNPVLLN